MFHTLVHRLLRAHACSIVTLQKHEYYNELIQSPEYSLTISISFYTIQKFTDSIKRYAACAALISWFYLYVFIWDYVHNCIRFIQKRYSVLNILWFIHNDMLWCSIKVSLPLHLEKYFDMRLLLMNLKLKSIA